MYVFIYTMNNEIHIDVCMYVLTSILILNSSLSGGAVEIELKLTQKHVKLNYKFPQGPSQLTQ